MIGAGKYYDAIVNSSVIANKIMSGNKFLGVATDTKSGQNYGAFKTDKGKVEIEKLDTTIIDAGSVVANKWSVALETGGNLAAVAIIKAMGIGTGEVSNALANFGGMLGSATMTEVAGGALGSFAGPLGTIAGSLLGAAVGGIFDKDLEPALKDNTSALASNTTAVENNNELLALQREFINAPTNYTPPGLYGVTGAQVGAINVHVYGGNSSNANDIANAVAKAVDDKISQTANRSQTRASRFGS
jgi:hypothetical protein